MKKICAVCVLIFAVFFAANSFAWWFEQKPVEMGTEVAVLPNGATTVQVAGQAYYYVHGAYYSRVGDHYMVIRPPIGAVVRSIPGYYQKLFISGVTYYTFKGSYYQRVDEGYRVVPAPAGAL